MKRLLAAMALSIMCATPSPALEVYGCVDSGASYLTPRGILKAWVCAEHVIVLSRAHPQPPGHENLHVRCKSLTTVTYKGIAYAVKSCEDGAYVLYPAGHEA